MRIANSNLLLFVFSKIGVCGEINPTEYGRSAKNLKRTDYLGKEKYSADHADNRSDILKNGGNGRSDAAHAEIPKEHGHDAAKDNRVEEGSKKGKRQHSRMEIVREDAVEDGRQCTECACPPRAQCSGDMTHNTHSEDRVHRPRNLCKKKEDIAIIERKSNEHLP